MLASKTSHKRRRSSARGDASRASVSDSRSVVTVAGSVKGKERQIDDVSWAWKRLERTIDSHAINHCISIPISSEGEVSALISQLPASSSAYLVKIPLCLFLDPIFITSHIKRGKLIALSKGRLDADDLVCLDGSGLLHLSLTRDSYQTLGLVGQVLKQSRTSSGSGRDRLSGKYERWMVSIDLLAPSFIPGKPGFDRTLARLKEWDERRSPASTGDHASWNVIFCWTDTESTSGAEMHFPSRYVAQDKVVKIDIKPSATTTSDCWVPLLPQEWSQGWRDDPKETHRMHWDSWNEELERLLEWNGLASMSAECIRTFARSDHLNSYQVGTAEARRPGSILQIQYRGLLSSDFCTTVMQNVHSFLLSNDVKSASDFAIISCSGFTDSPIAWKMSDMPAVPVDAVSVSSGDEALEDDDDLAMLYDADMLKETGPKARKLRQKKRAKRGTISRHQVGHQVRLPGSSNYNGWNVVLFNGHSRGHSKGQAAAAEYICVENIGGCLKC